MYDTGKNIPFIYLIEGERVIVRFNRNERFLPKDAMVKIEASAVQSPELGAMPSGGSEAGGGALAASMAVAMAIAIVEVNDNLLLQN